LWVLLQQLFLSLLANTAVSCENILYFWEDALWGIHLGL
jgi:hypothetical protein